MNILIPVWNEIIKANSGKNMDDLLLIFRKVCFLNQCKPICLSDVNNNDDDDIDGGGEDDAQCTVTTYKEKDIEGEFALVPFKDTYYPLAYYAFLKFGPPASPHDSPVFRAQLSNGPSKKSCSSDISVAASQISGSDIRSRIMSVSSISCDTGKAFPRKESREQNKKAKEAEELCSAIHVDFLKVSQNHTIVDVNNSEMVARQQRIAEFEKLIALVRSLLSHMELPQ